MGGRVERGWARVAEAVAAVRSPPGVPAPTGPAEQHRAAAEVVLDHVAPERADGVIAGLIARATAPVEPVALAAMDGVRLTAAELDAAGWSEASPPWLEVRARSRLGGVGPMNGLTGPIAADLATAAAGGARLEALGQVVLAPHLLHDLCRGPARAQGPGWPAWTMEEAAVSHLHRRAAPAHLLPETMGGALAGYRSFAMLGTYLAAWLGEETARAVATASASPLDGWGPDVGAALAVAELQAWRSTGAGHLGPAWSDPLAWLKLLSAVAHGGPLDGLLRPLRGRLADWALAEATPDLLAAASALAWDQLGAWSRPLPDEVTADALGFAVGAMFVEEAALGALHAAPSEPPGGRVTLDVAACTLRAAPRSHHQYTEPAVVLAPPAWCAALARRGVREVVIDGVGWAQRAELLARLQEIGASATAERVMARVGPPPGPVVRAASARQVRPVDGVMAVGGGLAEALADRLAAGGFEVGVNPLGRVEDPLGAARALRLAGSDEALPRDVVVPAEGGQWGGRGFDPGLRWANRPTALAGLSARVERARAALARRPLILLGWGTAWVGERLLEVDEVVAATDEALGEVASRWGAPRVLLVVDPSRDVGRCVEDDAAGKATLLLAARRLAGTIEVLPSLERARDVRDGPWLDAAGALTAEGLEVVAAMFEGAWLAPDARAWRVDGAAAQPLLARPAAEVVAEAVVELPVEGAWPAPLHAALRVGAWVGEEALAGWVDGVHAALDVRPAAVESEVLQALVDKLDELADPDVVGAIAARLLQEWLPTGAWQDAEAARWLALALQRRWVDEVVGWVPEARRVALGEALAATGRRPRPGAPLRTPWERAVVGLAGGEG
jgi:hypothetical protein